MVIDAAAMLARALAVAHELYSRTARWPAVLRVAPDVYMEIMLAGGAAAPADGAYGFTVVIDEFLPAGVWRLCDADETLLYDCREGRPVL